MQAGTDSSIRAGESCHRWWTPPLVAATSGGRGSPCPALYAWAAHLAMPADISLTFKNSVIEVYMAYEHAPIPCGTALALCEEQRRLAWHKRATGATRVLPPGMQHYTYKRR